MAPVNTLEELAAESEGRFDLARGALLLAREVRYPDLALDPWLRRLDELAAIVRPRVACLEPREQIAQLNRVLFKEFQFRGNAVDYYDPRNSYLNDVLTRRLGIPITLALVMIEVGRRADLDLYGVGLPGHFVVGARAGAERCYFDPFNRGAALDTASMARLVEESTGAAPVLDTSWLQPMNPRLLLSRMCGNLQGVYLLQQDWVRAILATERLFLFGSDPNTLRDLGFLCVQAGQLRRAASAFESYLINRPQADDAKVVQESLDVVYQRLALLN